MLGAVEGRQGAVYGSGIATSGLVFLGDSWSETQSVTMDRGQEARKRTYRPRPGEEHGERARRVPYSGATRSADHHRVQKASPTKTMDVDTMMDGVIVVGCLLAV